MTACCSNLKWLLYWRTATQGRKRGGGRQRERAGGGGIGTKKRKPEGRWWYGTFVSNPIPHTIWLHYHYAGEKTSVSLKIKTYLAPSKLTPNETCLSPCDSVSVIASLLHFLRLVFGSRLQLRAVLHGRVPASGPGVCEIEIERFPGD